MRTENKFEQLNRFQLVIVDLQAKIIKAKAEGVGQDRLQSSIDLMNNLVDIYHQYDQFYFDWVYASDKLMQKDKELLTQYDVIRTLREENDKLLKTLQWNT